MVPKGTSGRWALLSTSPFAPEVVATLGGPAWLADRRVAAAGRFDQRPTPTLADEAWRYGRIDEFVIDRFTPRTSVTDEAVHSNFDEVVHDPAAVVRTRDGVVTEIDLRHHENFIVQRLTESDPESLPLGVIAGIDEAFVDLAESLVVDGVIITVPAGIEVLRPIVVIHEFSGVPTPTVVTTTTAISVGEGGSATVIEHLVSAPGEILILPVTEIDIAASGTLIHQIVQELDPQSWMFGYQASRVAESGSFRSFVAALGGDYSRLLTRSSLVGELASSELLAAYLGTDTQMQHFVTQQEHAAPRTRSELIFKGAVDDSAQSIYIGLVHMAKGAKKSDASQTNRNLVLGDEAFAYSVPNLDIEENDVKCSHASAVGPIDPEQRFYLEARGIHPDTAERLILLGFFDDLLDRVVERGSATHVRAAVARALVGEESEMFA